MDYADIIARIAAAINDDEVAAITGPVGNGILNDMVAELGEGYQFAGILTPTSNPVRTDSRLWALAMTPGKYYNLDGRVLADGQVAVFMWGGGWSSVVLSVTTAEAVRELLSQFMDAATADAEVDLKADELTPVVPPMVAGSARGVLGRSAAARFLYRQTSSGSGAAWLRSIRGRTVSYNQLVRNGDFSDVSIWATTAVSYTVANNIATITKPSTGYGYLYRDANDIGIVVGHKYYYAATFDLTNFGYEAGVGFADASQGNIGRVAVTAGQKGRVGGVIVATSEIVRFVVRSTNASTGSFQASDVVLVDLTQAGLDSIITTPEQFEAWQMEQFGHNGYLGYTPGKLVNVNPTGIKTTTPGGDEHTLPLDFTEHFPTGMNGVNGIFDEVVSDENGKFSEGEKRFGIVDLGTLTWTIDAMSGIRIFKAYVTGGQGAGTTIVPANILTPIYPTVAASALVSKDKQIRGTFVASPNYTLQLGVRDSDYDNATAADFKAAMNGVPLVFELATPQHVTFTDPSDAVYPVTEGGTEQVLPVNGSEPTTIAPDFQMQAPLRRGYDTPTDATLDNFLEALGQHLDKTIAKEWDAETQTYQFDIL